MRKVELGTDHPDTLRSMNFLASSYAAMDKYAEAKAINNAMLDIMYAKFGRNHENIPGAIYGVAAAHARIITKAQVREKQAELTMEWLQQAIEAGYRNVDQLKKDKDLDALRERDDFKKLLCRS